MTIFSGGPARLAAAFLCLASAAPALSSSLLTNGGFESPDIGSAAYYGAGVTTITGWTVALQPGTPAGTQIQFTDNAGFCALGVCASEGSQFLDLTGVVGRGGGVVSNGFATTLGATYAVSFDVGAFLVAGQGSFGDATVDLFIDDAFVASFTNVLSRTTVGTEWERFSRNFTGTGKAMTVGLFASLSTGSSNLGVGLDAVSVDLIAPPRAVPEPASWAMMIAGFGLLGAVMRRRMPLRRAPA